jgi:hypothetical protein
MGWRETMKIGILKETTETEQRVALVPQVSQLLSKQKLNGLSKAVLESRQQEDKLTASTNATEFKQIKLCCREGELIVKADPAARSMLRKYV